MEKKENDLQKTLQNSQRRTTLKLPAKGIFNGNFVWGHPSYLYYGDVNILCKFLIWIYVRIEA